MCGIAGTYNLNGKPVSPTLIKRMTDIIAHRGPDGEGHYVEGSLALGHRRLAIIDLTEAGHQPMSNGDGTVIITYNGEIYNFQTLRTGLESLGHSFRSKTDTEVVIHAYEEWGPGCLDRFNGMFAFAIWDKKKRELFLARDRYGIKPLYWCMKDGSLHFASEIKAILEADVERRVSIDALAEYFTFQNIFSDKTLFDGIYLLPPGHYAVIKESSKSLSPVCYWDYSFSSDSMTDAEATDALFHLFEQAVTRQLVSDVPIGSYLSGGMDSGSITAVARRNLGRLTTYTCGFDLSSVSGLELGFDERAEAEVLSNLLKTEHYEVVLHAGDMEHIMPELIWHLEDLRIGQCYPNYYIARLAGKFTKVVLSGAGGDELFAGYPWRYYRVANCSSWEEYHQSYYNYWQRLTTDEEKEALFRPEVAKASSATPFDVFKSVFREGLSEPKTPEDSINVSLYFEAKTFLHGLFVVEDKISMAHSLESRVPFMDNDLVELAQKIPPHMKLKSIESVKTVDEDEPGAKARKYIATTNDGKNILRSAMKKIIPEEIVGRVKKGFSAPDATWFRGESIDYIKKLLLDPKARIYDYIQKDFVKARIDEHARGRHNHRLLIWSLLSFEWWLRRFIL